MDWNVLKAQGILFAHTLASSDMDKTQKIAALQEMNAKVIEEADDLVSIVPFGVGPVLRALVDNPVADAWERDHLAVWLAEAEYSAYAAIKSTVESLGGKLEAEMDKLAEKFGLSRPAAV